MIFREVMNRYLRATFKVMMKKKKKFQKAWEQVATFSMKTSQVAEQRLLTCVKLHGQKGEYPEENYCWQPSVLFLRSEQFTSKAHKAISLQANGVLSLGEVCSRWGQPQVETSELCSSVIDLNADQLLMAADLSWEWKAVNSLQLCEQSWPASQCLRAWCHRCWVSLGG